MGESVDLIIPPKIDPPDLDELTDKVRHRTDYYRAKTREWIDRLEDAFDEINFQARRGMVGAAIESIHKPNDDNPFLYIPLSSICDLWSVYDSIREYLEELRRTLPESDAESVNKLLDMLRRDCKAFEQARDAFL